MSLAAGPITFEGCLVAFRQELCMKHFECEQAEKGTE